MRLLRNYLNHFEIRIIMGFCFNIIFDLAAIAGVYCDLCWWTHCIFIFHHLVIILIGWFFFWYFYTITFSSFFTFISTQLGDEIYCDNFEMLVTMKSLFLVTSCSNMRTKKNPIAAVHSATGYSTSKTSFMDSETSGIIWRRHVAKKMPAAKQFKYAITSDLLFDFHRGIYQYIIILDCSQIFSFENNQEWRI